MGRIGPGELALIAFIALILFGATRLGDIGRGLADGIRNFKKGLKDDPEIEPKELPPGTKPNDVTVSSDVSVRDASGQVRR